MREEWPFRTRGQLGPEQHPSGPSIMIYSLGTSGLQGWIWQSSDCFVGISYALRRAVCENDEWSVTLLDLPENRDLSDSPDPSYKGEALVFVTKCFSG